MKILREVGFIPSNTKQTTYKIFYSVKTPIID